MSNIIALSKSGKSNCVAGVTISLETLESVATLKEQMAHLLSRLEKLAGVSNNTKLKEGANAMNDMLSQIQAIHCN